MSELYIWAKAAEGVDGDFTLRSILQNGIQDQLGPSFHAPRNGQVIDCGFWNGSFLDTQGTVIFEAYTGDLLIGSFKFSID